MTKTSTCRKIEGSVGKLVGGRNHALIDRSTRGKAHECIHTQLLLSNVSTEALLHTETERKSFHEDVRFDAPPACIGNGQLIACIVVVTRRC